MLNTGTDVKKGETKKNKKQALFMSSKYFKTHGKFNGFL